MDVSRIHYLLRIDFALMSSNIYAIPAVRAKFGINTCCESMRLMNILSVFKKVTFKRDRAVDRVVKQNTTFTRVLLIVNTIFVV